MGKQISSLYATKDLFLKYLWPRDVMPLSACRHNSNIIRMCVEAVTSLGYLVFLPKATRNFIVFEGIEIDLETSILSNGITAE